MKIFLLNPLVDPRWTRFVDRHPRASIFHTRSWLEALHRTYGYEPVAYTTTAPSEELTNGVVFCRIESWLTGRRLVSLPFSDHCEPLVNRKEEGDFLITSVIEAARREGFKYVEMRPLATQPLPAGNSAIVQTGSFYLHTVDLQRQIGEIFHSFHKTCVQAKIRRAEREGLSVLEGRSPELLSRFYRLMIATRRRHRLPPQPFAWYENLLDCMNDRLTIRVASKNDRPTASILTLSFKDRVCYKYGCSDHLFHNLGGMHLLLWQTIQQANERNAQILDLGRSDKEQAGLVKFKDHWGSTRSSLSYYRYPPTSPKNKIQKWSVAIAHHAFTRLPDSMLIAAGRVLYPHIG